MNVKQEAEAITKIYRVVMLFKEEALWAMHAEMRSPLPPTLTGAAHYVYIALPRDMGSAIDYNLMAVFSLWPLYLDVSVSRRINFAAYAWALEVVSPRETRTMKRRRSLSDKMALLTHGVEAHVDAAAIAAILGRPRIPSG